MEIAMALRKIDYLFSRARMSYFRSNIIVSFSSAKILKNSNSLLPATPSALPRINSKVL
jgi:hypothetical protein